MNVRPIARLLSAAALLTLALLAPTGAAQFDAPFGKSAGKGTDAPAQEEGPRVSVSVTPQQSRVSPGDQLALGVLFDHQEGWHVHPHEPVLPPEMGDFPVIPTDIDVTAPEGVTIGPIQWPETHFVEVNFTGTPVDYGVYEGEAVAYVPLVIGQDATVGGTIPLSVRVSYQACDDTTCEFPQEETFELSLPIVALGEQAGGEASGGGAAADADLFGGFDLSVFADLTDWGVEAVAFNVFGWQFSLSPSTPSGFALLLLLAALGGLLLNFTPCVLPVIPLKIMGLSNTAGSPAKCFALGAIMSAGVIAFWLAIGGAIAFISGFDQINALFQRPWFSIVVGVIIAAFAIVALGLFQIRLPNAVYRVNPSHDSIHGSFLFGIFTAILSTPCTAPFMGGAAAWAATQDPGVTLGAFAAIGVGMALPYLVLSANPKWISKLPRTGPASELIKQVMGLLLLAVAAFFLGVGLSAITNTPPDPPTRAYWWVVAAFLVIGGAWLVYKTFRITRSAPKRGVFGGLGLAMAALALIGAPALAGRGPIDWVYYTPDRFAQAQREGEVVVLDFTAEWCLNCKALESGVLHRDEIASLLEGEGVTPMKIDLTGDNPEGRAMLDELGWRGIPLLAVFGPELQAPILYGDGYTPSMVKKAIARAGGPTAGPTEEDAAQTASSAGM